VGLSLTTDALPRRFRPPWTIEDQTACFMIAPEEPLMKLKLIAAISALAIPALAHAQQGGPQPKPTTADAQNVVQIVISDKVKTQAYCDLTKLEGEVMAAAQKNDTNALETLSKQAKSLVDKLGPEYFKLMDGLEQVDPKSSEGKEFMSILSELDKHCTT
jgi:hypothetical protein